MGASFSVSRCGLISLVFIFSFRWLADAAFAEKVFGLKSKANRDGYEKAKLKEKSAFIGRDSFYLMQGLADQSVPFQHGFMWANALTEAKTLFKHQV